MNTDGASAYAGQKNHFPRPPHRESQRGVGAGPNGENNNLAEELNFRYDRAEKGVYLNVEPKYLLDYAG